jgi:hypothetical protein
VAESAIAVGSQNVCFAKSSHAEPYEDRLSVAKPNVLVCQFAQQCLGRSLRLVNTNLQIESQRIALALESDKHT